MKIRTVDNQVWQINVYYLGLENQRKAKYKSILSNKMVSLCWNALWLLNFMTYLPKKKASFG